MKTHFLIFLIILTFLVSCRQTEEVILHPFEVNRDLTCDDLIKQGYLGLVEDVPLLGKLNGDTLDYYQLSEDYDCEKWQNLREHLKGWIGFEEEPFRDNVYFNNEDSPFYNAMMHEVQDPDGLCACHSVYWRNIEIHVQPEDTVSIEQMIKNDFHKVLEIDYDSEYYIYIAKVLNTITLDTFECVMDERDGRYFFSSSIRLEENVPTIPLIREQ